MLKLLGQNTLTFLYCISKKRKDGNGRDTADSLRGFGPSLPLAPIPDSMIAYIPLLLISALNHYLYQDVYTFLTPLPPAATCLGSYMKIVQKYSLIPHLFTPLPTILFIRTRPLIIGGYLSLLYTSQAQS